MVNFLRCFYTGMALVVARRRPRRQETGYFIAINDEASNDLIRQGIRAPSQHMNGLSWYEMFHYKVARSSDLYMGHLYTGKTTPPQKDGRLGSTRHGFGLILLKHSGNIPRMVSHHILTVPRTILMCSSYNTGHFPCYLDKSRLEYV